MKKLLILLIVLIPLVANAQDVGSNNAKTRAWDGISIDMSWYNENSNELHISSAEALKAFSDIVNNDIDNFEGKVVCLDTDLDLNSFPWTPIGLSLMHNGEHPFKGTFDGKNRKIRNFYIDCSKININTYPAIGLFGLMKEGVIKNISIEGNIDINNGFWGSTIYIGGIVGCAKNSEIRHVSANINVSCGVGSTLNLGIIAGEANKIVEAEALGEIQDENYVYSRGHVGGIVGIGDTIEKADSKVTLHLRCFYRLCMGGIAANANVIKDVIYSGEYITGYNYSNMEPLLLGGICAEVYDGVIENAIVCQKGIRVESDLNLYNVYGGSIMPQVSSGSVKYSYYKEEDDQYQNIINNYGTPIKRERFTSGEILDGFSTDTWVFKSGELPKLLAFNNTPILTTYKLAYFVDGEIYKEYDLKEGDPITPEPDPFKEGYTFSGWSDIPSTMPAHDVIVTGYFTKNTFTLTYLVDDEVYKTYQLAEGATITPEPEPTKEGYIFSGWSDIPSTMPAHDVTVTGTFSKVIDTIEGQCGVNLYWSFNKSTKTLEISGTGEMWGYSAGNHPEWYSFEEEIENIFIQDGVISIGSYAFAGCKYVKQITIPNSVTTISNGAFSDCYRLPKITIPNSVTSIGVYAFYNCNCLSFIESLITNPFDIEIDTFGEITYDTAELSIPQDTKSAYLSKSGWNRFANISEPIFRPTLVAEKDWTNCSDADLLWYSIGNIVNGSVSASTEGIMIVNPERSTEFWSPETTILEGFSLIEGHSYLVKITTQIPTEGQLQLLLGSWETNTNLPELLDVGARDDYQVIEVTFNLFNKDCDGDARLIFQSGYIVGTTIVQKVQIYDLNDTGLMTIKTDSKTFDVYTINGYKIRSKATSIEDLPKGLYIINGKKIISVPLKLGRVKY